MKNIFYYLLLISLIGCKLHNNQCHIDTDFRVKFQNAIDIIKYSEKCNSVRVKDKLDAIFFLNAVTNIESRIRSPEVPIYDRKNWLAEDIDKWNEWYSKNKCSYTLEKADSIVHVYKYGRY